MSLLPLSFLYTTHASFATCCMQNSQFQNIIGDKAITNLEIVSLPVKRYADTWTERVKVYVDTLGNRRRAPAMYCSRSDP